MFLCISCVFSDCSALHRHVHSKYERFVSFLGSVATLVYSLSSECYVLGPNTDCNVLLPLKIKLLKECPYDKTLSNVIVLY